MGIGDGLIVKRFVDFKVSQLKSKWKSPNGKKILKYGNLYLLHLQIVFTMDTYITQEYALVYFVWISCS